MISNASARGQHGEGATPWEVNFRTDILGCVALCETAKRYLERSEAATINYMAQLAQGRDRSASAPRRRLHQAGRILTPRSCSRGKCEPSARDRWISRRRHRGAHIRDADPRAKQEMSSMAITVECQCAHRAELGEAPHWDTATQTLLWVDIEAGTVHRLHPDTGQRHDLRLAPPLGFAIPTSDDEMAIAVQHDIEIVDAHTQRRRLAVVEDGIDDLRINDGKCDPRGRLVFGSLSHSRTAGAGALYSLERNGALTRLLTSVTLSNGLGWDTSGTRFYYVDSTTQRIDLLDYDLSTGTVSARRPFAHIDPADGLPDGLAIDAEGGVWVSLFAGGAVRRYDDNGHLSEVVRLPVSAPTSLAFGGKDLDTLFITTARHRLNATQRHEQPLAGAVLSCRPEIAGVAVPRFGVVAGLEHRR